MGLIEDIEAEETEGRDYGCSACRALEALGPGPSRDALRAALGGRLAERAILRVSQKHDLGIGRAGIIKHREENHD